MEDGVAYPSESQDIIFVFTPRDSDIYSKKQFLNLSVISYSYLYNDYLNFGPNCYENEVI